MKQYTSSGYTYTESEYDLLPPEIICKIPLCAVNLEKMVYVELSKQDVVLGYLLAYIDRDISQRSIILYENVAGLIGFLFYSLKNSLNKIRLLKPHLPDDLKQYVGIYWDIEVSDDKLVYVISSKDIDKNFNLDEIMKASPSFDSLVGKMKCVANSVKESFVVDATIKNIDWFNDYLLKKQSNGYILLDPKCKDYGHLLYYITSFEHSFIETSASQPGLKAYVLNKITLFDEAFPGENRKK